MSTDIQIPITSSSVLSNIERVMTDSTYKDTIENAANYNTALRIDRKQRIPFLDSQTGLAQSPSNLFMDARQRMPGLAQGQVYTYPAKRWRKKRRQYLLNFMQPRRKELELDNSEVNVIAVENHNMSGNEDSKDSLIGNSGKDESSSKDAWYYDELEMPDVEAYDEQDADSDYDYEDSYTKKRRRRSGKPGGRGGFSDSPNRRGLKGLSGRGRRRTINYQPDYDSEKPYYCDLCGARYKTRPGLTYHYTHSHKEKPATQEDESNHSAEAAPSSPSTNLKDKQAVMGGMTTSMGQLSQMPQLPQIPTVLQMGNTHPTGHSSVHANVPHTELPSTSGGWPGKFQDSYLTFLNTGSSAAGAGPSSMPVPTNANANTNCQKKMTRSNQPQVILPQMTNIMTASPSSSNSNIITTTASPIAAATITASPQDEESSPVTSESDKKDDVSQTLSPATKSEEKSEKSSASPYCDFCLGNEEANKKSGQPEVLVSCSDCGRSGHPTCLQFTANMIVSVRKYRWQCIECKCCSICGTSDNDDQLLFCDDCDRGYHMYCLKPALSSPPEGSWSCTLCIKQFHSK